LSQEDLVKKFAIALVVAVASVGLASAQTPPKTVKPAQTKTVPVKAAPAAKTPLVKAEIAKGEVVSTDAIAKTITVKDAAGTSTTYTVTGAAALKALAKVQAGEAVTITHRDMNATRIVKTKVAAKKAPKK
jgi:hypothetical protein